MHVQLYTRFYRHFNRCHGLANIFVWIQSRAQIDLNLEQKLKNVKQKIKYQSGKQLLWSPWLTF
jgi:hypothetical protein